MCRRAPWRSAPSPSGTWKDGPCDAARGPRPRGPRVPHSALTVTPKTPYLHHQPPRITRSASSDERNRHHRGEATDRKSTRLNSSHVAISYAAFCLKKKILKKRMIE